MKLNQYISILALSTTSLILMSCTKTVNSSTAGTSTEDSSTSGTVASVAGGALSSSNSAGTIALQKQKLNLFSFISEAYASGACPKYSSASGSGCNASGSTMWLTHSSCSRGNSGATWTGIEALTMSSGSASCGAFPNPPANGTLTRQFVTAASGTTPGTATRVNEKGVSVTIDDASANLSNFDTQTISTVANSGYGTIASFTNGARSSLTIKRRLHAAGKFDHTVVGNLTVSEASSGSTSRTISGFVTTYHNLMKVVATSIFSSVTHSDTCCTPVSGTIATTFAAGQNVAPTTAGAAMVGKTEIMVFTGCKTADLTGTDGTTTSVSLSHCF